MLQEVRKVAHCPHCGNDAPQKLIHRQQYLERCWNDADLTETDPLPWSVFVAVCETCEHLLLYENHWNEHEDCDFDQCEQVYPGSLRGTDIVPRGVGAAYAKAIRVRALDPSSFAVGIRRALEALCKDKGLTAKKQSLHDKLQALAKRGDLPPVLADATGVLKEIGNAGAHDGSVHPLAVPEIDDFFRAVIEYVYIAPHRLDKFRRHLGPS